MNDERFEEVRKFRADMPEIYRRTYDKAIKGSLRAAVNSKCLDCSCWQRKEVQDCLVLACPLWTVRPYQQKAIPAKKSAKTRHFSKKLCSMVSE